MVACSGVTKLGDVQGLNGIPYPTCSSGDASSEKERNLNAKWSLHNKLGQVSLRTTMMVLILILHQ
ncbi:hypothetical protein Hdeb2414_s0022g00616061 [Helianthus debilis subsp. tardiflorus]